MLTLCLILVAVLLVALIVCVFCWGIFEEAGFLGWILSLNAINTLLDVLGTVLSALFSAIGDQ